MLCDRKTCISVSNIQICELHVYKDTKLIPIPVTQATFQCRLLFLFIAVTDFVVVPHVWQVWHGGSTSNNWRQQPVEESQQQFIPLQAVKQQRSRLLGAPLQQHGSREWPQQQQQQPAVQQNMLPHVEATVTSKVIKCTCSINLDIGNLFGLYLGGKRYKRRLELQPTNEPWLSCGSIAPVFLNLWH